MAMIREATAREEGSMGLARRTRVGLALPLLAVLAIGWGGCGDDDESGSADSGASPYGGGAAQTDDSAQGDGSGDDDAPTGGSAGGGEQAVTISDFKFDPDALTVEAGTEVVWTNEDSADHTATAEDDSFDTGTFGKGEEGSAVLDEPGTYPYICDLHPFMEGEIVVE